MRPFKFLRSPIATACDGGYIYAEKYFYTMNKVELTHTHQDGRISITPKYSIVTRFLPKIYENKFKPDYSRLLYFRTKESAEFHKGRLIHWDEHVVRSREIGEEFHRQAEHTITFQR